MQGFDVFFEVNLHNALSHWVIGDALIMLVWHHAGDLYGLCIDSWFLNMFATYFFIYMDIST